MQTCLVAYEALNAVQQQQVSAIEVHPEQLPFCGDMYCALNSLLAKPSPGVKGFALLADDIPVAFLLLKRPPCLPHWADEHSATLHALQVDRRQQGMGFGKACLQALPAVALETWPQIKGLELSVDRENVAAMGLYLGAGWEDHGEAYKARVGFERRLILAFVKGNLASD
ncbi:GNAT family N-acetyltransferase [Pseudomonas fluorescens]|uniref:GNAT family N-acetyltransferase n=1 Tax=Pseudomonas TaxID=286 RepID=UPI00178058F1|nr:MULTISPECIES: GNAT family N-acetyltransferase [Pseudomonas]MBD8192680.1 GNAT family N-acetyltransferase [Pseudomonas fluorescens]MBD8227271.1 GNAT family N-acetyltransferase [Pseudomonas fluorescens]MBD8785238.1 GNAT family N-acetyltransferase [Pseudomonas fluorescens]MBD8817466.1 GNAT family N-acetyltransferase [Pseudomonas fluorescens]MCM2364493.1 GNAT family N-acetyltransferase [Pseudomonas sp. SR18]